MGRGWSLLQDNGYALMVVLFHVSKWCFFIWAFSQFFGLERVIVEYLKILLGSNQGDYIDYHSKREVAHKSSLVKTLFPFGTGHVINMQ